MKFVQFLLIFFVVSFSFGQPSSRYDLSTPRKAVEHHLKYLQDESYRPKISSLALDTSKTSLEDSPSRLAIKLKQIYDGAGHMIVLRKIPDTAAFKDSLGDYHYVVDEDFPNLYLERIDGQWKYSAESVAHIDKAHKKVYPFGTHKLLDLVSKSSNDKFLGLYTWQYVGIFILILSGFLFHKVLTLVVDRIIVAYFKRFDFADRVNPYILPIVKPFSLFLVTLLYLIAIPVLQLSVNFSAFVLMGLRAAIPIFWTIIFYRLVDALGSYLKRVADRTENTLDDQLVPLVQKALKAFVIIIGLLLFLQNLQINVTALLTGLSIGGLAFALASQDMLKNFFGSLMIFIDRPFTIGDWISGNGIDGDVEEVGFRSTRIRTFHNSLISIPNGVLADMTVDNLGMRTFRRYKTYIAVTYDTPAEVLDVFVEGLRKIVEDHPATPSPQDKAYHVYVNAFGESSIDVLFYIFFEVSDWAQELKARHEINLEIIKLANAMGVRFAFRTQTLHIEEFPEKRALTPPRRNRNEVRNDMESYFISKG